MSDETGTAGVMLGFGELEFLFAEESRWPLMREQLSGKIPDSMMIAESGAASFLARRLATMDDGGLIHVATAVRTLTAPLLGCPCPIGIALVVGETTSPAVYCATDQGDHTLVSIEFPGVALFQPLPADSSPVDQAFELASKAMAVENGMVAVKAIGQSGCLVRRRGHEWQLGDTTRDPSDPEDFFRPSTEETSTRAVRDYLAVNMAPLTGPGA